MTDAFDQQILKSGRQRILERTKEAFGFPILSSPDMIKFKKGLCEAEGCIHRISFRATTRSLMFGIYLCKEHAALAQVMNEGVVLKVANVE